MWFLILIACIALASAGIALAKRRRRRDRRVILGEMKALVRLLDEPTADPPIRFTYPHRCHEDREHDTMFIACHGGIRLSIILDTSRMRIRWWVLYEVFEPESAGAARTLRVESDFIERAIPTALIQALLKAARGETRPLAAKAAPSLPEDPPVDPFEPAESALIEPTAQASSPIASATGD